ncbi:phosphoribosyltransferase family protein [Lactiplantibacillus pentosus]|uniref:Phosphoribosyltransferase family protein n=3 Tax=Lactiplantibacillus pentosus TaxID=1589 RepID=A0AAN1F2E9_LACPE|nr:phosphoribosyltransferase family protein [Lactiplantibacillus pentosus]ASG78778.1 adenine phosphoribosyltransferase [Lactiplantibacillus pentosus]AYJ41501.1 adenine phosphoribosyltransferase [Lactiplantibacillus pentosus]KRK22783.1 purine pyrimidine phosphoribosyltransferase [Lactiplantibacillus pentosus DSM 20314]MBU7497226.1 adenine phosphoribosyltransferase [Lactiplantibacillus pentosus]MCC3163992.1 adenine phosphoribosyltransferase [Lactiplantibacillus pentosus]
MQQYQLRLGPLTRNLPLIQIAPNTRIASFVLLGDAELTQYAAQQLAQRLTHTPFDYLVTMESKGIPLAQALSQLTHHPRFIVLRKSVKPYMTHPHTIAVTAITTHTPQQLVLDDADATLLRGKRVVIVDDVISTGGSLEAANRLLQQVGAQVVAQTAILAEGAAGTRTDIEFLAKLPLFDGNSSE